MGAVVFVGVLGGCVWWVLGEEFGCVSTSYTCLCTNTCFCKYMLVVYTHTHPLSHPPTPTRTHSQAHHTPYLELHSLFNFRFVLNELENNMRCTLGYLEDLAIRSFDR